MRDISKPAARTFFCAYGPDGTMHEGVTEPDQVTTTGQPSLISDMDAEAYAAKVQSASLTASLAPIPAVGEVVEKDRVYNWNGKAVVCYQSHTRMEFDPDKTPALFGLAKALGDPWVQPTGAHDAYKRGAIVTYAGKTWINTGSDANVWQPGVFGWVVKT